MKVAGKSAVVTGAAAGIGRAVARAFVRGGASVLVADVDEEWGREAELELQAKGALRSSFARTFRPKTTSGR